MVNLGNDWDEILKDEFQKDYYRNLRKFLADEYRKCVVYPNMYDIFNALRYTSFENTRAVILGQDPYHGPHHRQCILPSRVFHFEAIFADFIDEYGESL